MDPADVQEVLDSLGRIAAALAHYVEALEGAGFTREEALGLAAHAQVEMMRGGRE